MVEKTKRVFSDVETIDKFQNYSFIKTIDKFHHSNKIIHRSYKVYGTWQKLFEPFCHIYQRNFSFIKNLALYLLKSTIFNKLHKP